VGVKSRLMGGKLAWTNSLFTIRRNNASLQDPSNGPNDSFVVNGGKSKITGFESELTARVGRHLRLRSGVALQKSRIVANDNTSFVGNRFANTPEHQVSLLASYTWADFGLRQLTTDLGLTRIGQRWGNSGNTISLPGYTLVSLGASYPITPATSVRLSVANATDKTYYTGMQDSGERADQVMVGAGRNAYLTLTHNF
jgi:iron complex outermembrane recepter protein